MYRKGLCGFFPVLEFALARRKVTWSKVLQVLWTRGRGCLHDERKKYMGGRPSVILSFCLSVCRGSGPHAYRTEDVTPRTAPPVN